VVYIGYNFGGVLENKLLTRHVGRNHEGYFPIAQCITERRKQT
jgi:hypothetical protein